MGDYVLTQADVDGVSVSNTATVTASTPAAASVGMVSGEDSDLVSWLVAPALSIGEPVGINDTQSYVAMSKKGIFVSSFQDGFGRSLRLYCVFFRCSSRPGDRWMPITLGVDDTTCI